MNQFFEAFANMFRIPDLRKRLLLRLRCWRCIAWRLPAHAGNQYGCPAQFFNSNQGSVLGVIDLFSGGNFRRRRARLPFAKSR